MQRELLKFAREVLTTVPMAEIKWDVVDLMQTDAATIILRNVFFAETKLNLIFLRLTIFKKVEK